MNDNAGLDKQLNVRVTDHLLELAHAQSKQTGIPLSRFVRQALVAWITRGWSPFVQPLPTDTERKPDDQRTDD